MEVEEKREKEWRGDASDRASSPKKASRLHRICQRRLEIAINTSKLKTITLGPTLHQTMSLPPSLSPSLPLHPYAQVAM